MKNLHGYTHIKSETSLARLIKSNLIFRVDKQKNLRLQEG